MSKELDLQIISGWIVNPFSQESENLASKSHETRRIPDPYIFLISDGKLKTPGGDNVEDSVQRGNTVYESEYEAMQKIQDWAGSSEEGMSFWFSPPYSGGYSCLKIVASEILYAVSGEKVLFNRAIILDVGARQSLEIANQISGKFFTDTESLRGSPIFLNTGEDWLKILTLYTSQTGKIEASEDVVIKQKTLREISNIYVSVYSGERIINPYYSAEEEARKRGLIGEKEDSCSTSSSGSFNTFLKNSEIQGKFESFPCPRCHGPIPSGLGITTCPYCGMTKEEAGSTCG